MIGDDYEHIVEDEIMEKVADSNPEESNSKRSPKKKKRCVVMLCFSLFLSLSLGADNKEMEMNFRNPKEVFVQDGSIHKILSHFCNKYHSLIDSNSSLWPIFQALKYLIISCFSHKFPACIMINLRGIFKNHEWFLFIMDSFRKTSFSFCTGETD